MRETTGCLTCRIRKVKCDEQRPVCQRCKKASIKCDWLEPGQSLSQTKTPNPGTGSRNPKTLAPLSPATTVTPVQPHQPQDTETRDDLTSSPLGISSQNSPQSTLSTNHIPLSNSLQLSADERAAFLYIPDSVLVLYYGKPWKWSCISYIYTNIASQYSGVMKGFIAVAAMELKSREILAAQDGITPALSLDRAQRLGDIAAAHYSLALKDLSSLIDHVCHSQGRSSDINALFTMWFLILRFEEYDAESTGTSLVHLDGIRSFLEPYIQTHDLANRQKLPYVSQIMLLYTL